MKTNGNGESVGPYNDHFWYSHQNTWNVDSCTGVRTVHRAIVLPLANMEYVGLDIST